MGDVNLKCGVKNMYPMLFDFENLALRCFYGVKEVEAESESPNYQIWEYMVFNSVYRMLFKERVNEIVIALDSQSSWRKIVYPEYKANRKKKKEESNVNWELFHEKKNNFLEEMKNNLPFKIIGANRAEADDIIGVLVNHNRLKNPIIVSMDCDYMQLSKKARIYNPIKKEFKPSEDPEKFLVYSSLAGQSKDNLLNVKTPSDWPEDRKKPPMGEKGIQKLILNEELDSFLDTPIEYEYKDEDDKVIYKASVLPRERYELNRKLIDFNCTPKVIVEKTLEVYDKYEIYSDPNDLYVYFKSKGWNEVLDNFTQVESKMLELY